MLTVRCRLIGQRGSGVPVVSILFQFVAYIFKVRSENELLNWFAEGNQTRMLYTHENGTKMTLISTI